MGSSHVHIDAQLNEDLLVFAPRRSGSSWVAGAKLKKGLLLEPGLSVEGGLGVGG